MFRLTLPSEIALLHTFAGIAVKYHPTFENLVEAGYTDNIKPLEYLREDFADMVLKVARETVDVDIEVKHDIFLDIAHEMYEPPKDEYGVRPAQTVTGFEKITDPETGEKRACMEIPMSGATPEVLYYDNETGAENTEELDVFFANNCVYVPTAKLWNDFREKYGQALFDYHLEIAEERLNKKNIDWILNKTSRIHNRIEFWENNGHKEHLYDNYDPEEQTVKAIRAAVRSEADEDEDRYTSVQILEAIESYEPSENWIATELEQLNTKNQHAIARELRELEDKISVEETDERLPNIYSFSTGSGDLEINEIENLLQLPCIKNLDEKLQGRSSGCTDGDSLRWELFTLVRMIMWMPPWYDAESGEFNKEKVLKDVKEFFDGRYPWYDEETTEYQVRYEFRQNDVSEFGSPNCGNKNIDTYCIGQTKCDHTIYGSLPFPEQHFESLPDTDNSTL